MLASGSASPGPRRTPSSGCPHACTSGYTVSGVIVKYTVVLQRTEEGYSVGCPGLPGCWSQGATEQEALENIQAAIREYLAAVRDSLNDGEIREVEVAV
jgi:predicted RNase H-like HicB family nuclease